MIAFALIGIAAAASLPDSATQGPNPQDIATPEPEYIDIDLPESAPAPAPAALPKPIAPVQRFNAPAPRPVQRPVQSFVAAPTIQHIPQQFPLQLAGHVHSQSGYQYRRPVYVRRVYRRFV